MLVQAFMIVTVLLVYQEKLEKEPFVKMPVLQVNIIIVDFVLIALHNVKHVELHQHFALHVKTT
jgi:hypothetical protein